MPGRRKCEPGCLCGHHDRRNTPEIILSRFKESRINSWNGIPCREWTYGRLCRISGHKESYGVVDYQGKRWRVHRLVWTIKKGLIPKGINVLHHCDNPPCGVIEHLFLGTAEENNKDKAIKGRSRNRYSKSKDGYKNP